MTQPAYINPASDTAVGTATIAASNNTFTLTSHGLVDEDRIVVSNLTGGAVGAVAEDGVYWVRDATSDTFAISISRRGLPVDFSSDGGADIDTYEPGYDARELRRIMSGLLYPDPVNDYLDAREGILPAKTPFYSITGSDWTVFDNVFVVCPGITSTSGPYIAYILEDSGTLNPADGSDDRIDALDLQIQDNDEDTSGFRRARIVPVTGTPGAGEPGLTANSYRIVSWLVSAGGTPAPEVNEEGVMTVTRGGILPFFAGQQPDATNLPQGAASWDIVNRALQLVVNGQWATVGSTRGYQFGGRIVHTSGSGTFDKGNFPGLRAIDVQCKGGGGGSGGIADSSSAAAEAGGGGSGGYCRAFIPAGDLGASESYSVGSGGTGGASGNNDGSAGGDTTFSRTTGSNLSANGGGGGDGMAGIDSFGATAFGGAAGTATGGDLNVGGDSGGNGRVIIADNGNPLPLNANYGGAGMLSGSPQAGSNNSNGVDGKNYGGGASGPRGDNGSARAGADGDDGVIIIELYY